MPLKKDTAKNLRSGSIATEDMSQVAKDTDKDTMAASGGTGGSGQEAAGLSLDEKLNKISDAQIK